MAVCTQQQRRKRETRLVCTATTSIKRRPETKGTEPSSWALFSPPPPEESQLSERPAAPGLSVHWGSGKGSFQRAGATPDFRGPKLAREAGSVAQRVERPPGTGPPSEQSVPGASEARGAPVLGKRRRPPPPATHESTTALIPSVLSRLAGYGSPLKGAGKPFPSSHGVSGLSREPRSVSSPPPLPLRAPDGRPACALPPPCPSGVQRRGARQEDGRWPWC